MKLAGGQEFLEQQLSLADEIFPGKNLPSITQALQLIRDHDRQEKVKPLELPPSELEEPLLLLRDELRAYVYKQFQLQYEAEQIQFRMKNAKLGRRQIRQAIEWATQEHLEVREIILKTFLG